MQTTLKPENSTTEAPPFRPLLQPLDFQKLVPLLQQVDKPGRYVGGEFGIARKDPHTVRARLLLSYPDIYELGMSNQGLKILYDCVNRRPDFLADRAYLPWHDFSNLLQTHDLPLYSLDNFLTASSFDVWGFNIPHELHYTNLLNALELARIPLLRTERNPQDPFIITGGTSVSNPLPLFDFADGVFLGDGEEGIRNILEIVAAGRENQKTRRQILEDLQETPGLVLPEFYDVENSPQIKYHGRAIPPQKYFATEFSVLENYIVPNIAITQDRLVLETARGCAQGCRFCHAGFWKRPLRNAGVTNLVAAAEQMLTRTGFDSISLHALSIADYPWLEELVVELAQKFGSDGVSLSLPSLRVQVKTIPVLEMTSNIRRSSVTFALESGSELQRERIFKKSSEENLQYLVREIYSRGWDLIKVYFMLGLPDPDNREVDDLIRALNELGDIAHECGSRKQVNATISLFVPKPFTTFQWEAQRDPQYFETSIAKIQAGMRSKRVRLKHSKPHQAYLEGLLSRSDHRSGRYILDAYRRGARFDSWDDGFKYDIWKQVFAEIPPELTAAWMAKKPGGTPMPYEDVSVGVPRTHLIRDYQRFEKVTEETMNPPHPQALKSSDFPPELLKPVSIPDHKFKTACLLAIDFEKSGPFIYVSHLDTMEVFRKALRRCRLPMTFTRGFNKHEKFHHIQSLPLYFYSEAEILYVELFEKIDTVACLQELTRNLPPGLRTTALRLGPLSMRKQGLNQPTVYRLDFFDQTPFERTRTLLQNAPETFSFQKTSKKRRQRGLILGVEKRLQSAIHALSAHENTIQFTLESPQTDAISITDLLPQYLELPVETWNVDFKISRQRPTALE